MTTLQRNVTLPLLVLYGLGTILGAGIYVLTGVVASHAGSFTPVAFLLAAIVVLPTAYSFANLSVLFPRAAGSAIYVREAFNSDNLGSIAGLLVVCVGVISAATIANGFVGYFQVFVDLPRSLVITLLVFILCGTAAYGVLESVMVAGCIAVLETLGLLMIIHGGFVSPTVQAVELVPAFDGVIWAGILSGALLAFYAFLGFEDMVNLAEETKKPEINFPIAIYGSLALAAVLYFLVTFVAVTTVPLAQLSSHEAPMALVVQQHGIYNPELISLISMLAVVNGALVQIIMGSRVVYGVAKMHADDHVFAVINPSTRTPVRATILVSSIVLVLALSLELESLATLTSAITLVIFVAINISLIVIRADEPIQARLVPGLGVFLCCALFLGVF